MFDFAVLSAIDETKQYSKDTIQYVAQDLGSITNDELY